MTEKIRYIIVLGDGDPYIENIKNVKDPFEYYHHLYDKSYLNPYITCIESPYKNIYYVYKDKRDSYAGMKLEYAKKILPFF